MSSIYHELLNTIVTFLYYAKPYEGPAWRDGKRFDKVRFYNEREWRFVPKDIFSVERMTPTKPTSNELRAKVEKANRALAEKVRISFGPDDIQYIIVKEENEILDMISQIEQLTPS